MRILKNPTENQIDIPYEGWTYNIPANGAVLVDDKVADFLYERYPFLEIEKPPSGKKEVATVPQVKRVKTPVFIKPEKVQEAPQHDMGVIPVMKNDATIDVEGLPESGSTDRDGVEWVGEGIEIDTDLTRKGVFR